MQANYVQRLRLTISKTGPTRFIGHLDLARALERAFNRAQIPIAYSQGFNPRPRMQLAAALPLGFTSECELVDIWLEKEMEPAEAHQQIIARMAPGIEIFQLVQVPLNDPPLQTQTAESLYSVELLDPISREDLQERIDSFLASPSFIKERGHGKKRKSYDLRPLVIDLRIDESITDSNTLSIHLHQSEGRTGRPDELVEALGLDPLASRIHRKKIVLANEISIEMG